LTQRPELELPFDWGPEVWHPPAVPWSALFGVLLLTVSTLSAAEQVPDFKLQDVSVSSPRAGATVSPRDYIMQVSGYYFGEAT
jgi:hypothetical protein